MKPDDAEVAHFHAIEDQLEKLRWQDLVSEAETRRLAAELSGLCGSAVAIPEHKPEGPSWPVRHQLETVAHVSADLPEERLRHLAAVVERVLYQASRYYLAANLHLDVVNKNYAELKEQHEALKASEARYRELSGQLEQRVQEQVARIEDRQRRLYASEKLNAVGRLGAGVAHEINNPIGFVQSNLNAAQAYINDLRQLRGKLEALPGGPELVRDEDLGFVLDDFEDLTRESLSGAGRIAAIVSALRRFAGTDDTGPQMLSLNELLSGVWDVASPHLQAEAEVEWHLDDSVSPLYLDRASLSQAFYNIVENCAQSASRKIGLSIRTEQAEDGVRATICDNGDGMGQDVLEHVFEPFFTTRPVGSGTGLGLTVCRDTVLAHGGTIDVTSEPGQGSCFHLWFPLPATGN